ncbi:nucleophosmin-like [Scophthalmus maximus]|uniref:nucleophosmin-like n=1 Tax=Scophthalmus maximus TaxID=52904 RepID=UPI001FA88616|nr:nucleophosmin-like [Scophthalmus maximus]
MTEQWPHLEPIQEESEQEDDETGGESPTGGGERDFQSQVGEETEEMMAEHDDDDDDDDEEEEEEEEDVPLRVMRPRRLSRSLSQGSLLRTRSTSGSGRGTSAADLSDEAATPKLGSAKQSRGRELTVKFPAKIRWQKGPPPKPSVEKMKTKRKRGEESSLSEPFPQWLVELMVNIEEATTHPLVVE